MTRSVSAFAVAIAAALVVLAGGAVVGVRGAYALGASDVAGSLDGQPVTVAEVDLVLGGTIARRWEDMGAVQRRAAYALCREHAQALLAEQARLTPLGWRAHVWSSTSDAGGHEQRVHAYRQRIEDKADALIGDSFELYQPVDHAPGRGRIASEPQLPFLAASCLGAQITREQVERFAAIPLYRMRAETVTAVCRQFGIEESNPLLLHRIARQRGMTMRALLQAIEAVPGPPTAEEIAAKARERYGDTSEPSLFKARVALEAARRSDQGVQLASEVRRRVHGVCSLELPPPPVTDVRGLGLGQGPVGGLRVQYFGGFRCQRCEQGWETLKSLSRRHANEVRVEFRHHFPDTVLAYFRDALAFECSAQQGELWRFGDWIARGGSVEQTASALLLDERAYDACLQDPKVAVKILDDTAEALRLGFRQAVPSWVVGRRPRRGHQSEVALDELIRRETSAWASRIQ